MISEGQKIVLSSCLLIAGGFVGKNAYAQTVIPPAAETGHEASSETAITAPVSSSSDQTAGADHGQSQDGQFSETKLGLSLLKNIVLDQKAVWTSPSRLRWDDANWLLPFAGIAAASLETDTNISRALTHSPTRVRESNTLSNYGVAAFGGIAGGAYLLGKITHDDHEQETALLSGEAAVDSLAVTTSLQYAFGRQRPADGNGGGGFWHGGTSFPSDHSTAAWAIASVFAHEYPGPLTQFLAYGLASAVSVSRVTGKDHFPTDVLVGSAIGWFMGQYVYRAHHDPELGGSSWETLREARDSEPDRNSKNSGSPYVPLDSWIYPAIERLAALGYIHTDYLGLRPWTRIECATFVEEAAQGIAGSESSSGSGEADGLYTALAKEFHDDLAIVDGQGAERSIKVESVYAGATEISGKPLDDSYHFGQTIINNFGRPYQEGLNSYDGFSSYATLGPFAIYVRGEYQHSPFAPAYPLAARQAIATVDENPLQPATPFATVNQFTLLDTYVAANVSGWDLTFGKQSLWWGQAEGGAFFFSDNAEPMYMFRASQIAPIELPWIFRWLGAMKVDLFWGQMSGNLFPAGPMMHGEKITFKHTPHLELSFVRTAELGGTGRPITLSAVLNSYFSLRSSDLASVNSNPGKRTLGMDFSYDIPHFRNWVRLYADSLLPEDNVTNFDTSPSWINAPRRAALRTGIYMPRVPGFQKLDFRVEAGYTDPPTPRSVSGQYVYWNDFYHDLDTNKGNLIGDWIGREGMGFQGWSTYWFSPRNSVQFGYRHAKVASDFIPGGETISDGSVKVGWQIRSDLSVSTSLQYEKWVAPILASTPQTNWTSSVQIQFFPHLWRQ